MVTIEEAQGDKALMNTFIEENLKLVHMILRTRLANYLESMNYDDLFQTGCIGLYKAALRYDPQYGYSFSTYAVPMIEGYIRQYRRDYDSTNLHVPRPVKERFFDVRKLQNLGMDDENICIKMKISRQLFDECIKAMEFTKSLDEVFYDSHSGDDGRTYYDSLESDYDIEEKVITNHETKDKFNLLKSRLKEKDFTILMLRLKGENQKDIAKAAGIHQVSVSRRLKNIEKICEEISRAYDAISA